MPTSTEESLHSDERLRTHRFRVKGPPKLLVEVEEELPCEYWLERVLYDEEASEAEGDTLSKQQQPSSNDDDDMPSKPEESSSNEENDGDEDRDSGGGGALYEESTESRFICLASSKEFMMKVDGDYESKFMSLTGNKKCHYWRQSGNVLSTLDAVRWLDFPMNNNTYIRKTMF